MTTAAKSWNFRPRPDDSVFAEAQAHFPDAAGLPETMIAARGKPGAQVNDTIRVHPAANSRRSIALYLPHRTRAGQYGWRLTLFSDTLGYGARGRTVWIDAAEWDGKPPAATPAETPPPPAPVVPKSVEHQFALALARKPARTRAQVQEFYANAPICPASHPYLRGRGIAPNPSIRRSNQRIWRVKRGMALFPVLGYDGEVLNVLAIGAPNRQGTAEKRYGGAGGTGMTWPTPIWGKAAPRAVSVIAEGYATAEAVRPADARIIVSQGDCRIPLAVRQEFELAERVGLKIRIVIVADNNPGAREIAAEQVRKYPGRVSVLQVEGAHGRDLNDVMREDRAEFAALMGGAGL